MVFYRIHQFIYQNLGTFKNNRPFLNLMVEKDFYEHVRNENPIVQLMVNKYFTKLNHKLSGLEISSALDVGCGKGEVTRYIGHFNETSIIGVDIKKENIQFIGDYDDKQVVFCGDGLKLPFQDDLFDLVIATEVLEHQTEPETMMEEMYRTCNKYGFFSVPNEPYWRMGNIVRGSYLKNLGDTPDHIQHWSKKSFKKFLSNFFSEVNVESAWVWSMALCKK